MNVSKFETALKNTIAGEVSITENGAIGFKTSGKALLDINFGVSSLRGKSDAEITKMYSAAYYEDPLLAIKWLFLARDIRGNGMRERNLFRVCMKWLYGIKPEAVKALIPLVAEYGREDDLLVFADTDLWQNVVRYIDDKISDDIDKMGASKSISLLAKWLPSINTSSQSTRQLAKKLAKDLGLTEKAYRQMLSKLRKYLNVTEVKTSANKWSEIDYSSVCSGANLKYKNAFLKHDEARRREFLGKLEKGEVKINSSTSFPSDIVHAYSKNQSGYWRSCIFTKDAALEGMWKALPDYIKGNEDGSTIVVADSSGSMTSSVSGTSMTFMEVAYSLAIYFAERLNGPFKDKTITFSEHPKFLDMSNASSLAEKLEIMYSFSEVANTNIEAVFDLILRTAKDNKLSQKDLPSNILIVSDMEFDGSVDFGYSSWSRDQSQSYNAKKLALFETIKRKFEGAGYKLPRLVFWNVNSRTKTIPLTTNELGVALVSGYSPAIANMVFSAKMDPYEVLIDAVNAKRYDAVQKAIETLL